jgi:hypothetical protein
MIFETPYTKYEGKWILWDRKTDDVIHFIIKHTGKHLNNIYFRGVVIYKSRAEVSDPIGFVDKFSDNQIYTPTQKDYRKVIRSII